MTSGTNKKPLRLDAQKRRKIAAEAGTGPAIAAAGHAPAVMALAPAVMALAPGAAPVISAYLAIGSELDPARLAAALGALGATIALPVMTAPAKAAAPLEFRAWVPGDPLVERMWRIREPGPECPPVEPDILLVPLLLVDRLGNRLGYGGGYYDRTLNQLRAKRTIIAIGFCYDAQKVDAVPHEAYDEPLDHLLTPSGLYPFNH